MKIETLVVGFLKENCYIVTKEDKTIIIDPGAESKRIIEFCKNKNVVGVLITHHHFDHVGALRDVENHFGIKEGNEIPGINYEIIETPGHASDLKTYYFKEDKVMFTGDFLFRGTIGRTDLPTSSNEDMKESLEKIKKYPGNTKIYPGHGKSTVLGDETSKFTEYLQILEG